MTVPRFYSETLLEEGQSGGLSAEQARQLRKVLRLEPGNSIALFDGSGNEARASITELRKDRASYRVEELTRPAREPELELTVGLALLRGNRFDTAVQQLTELGVARIVPLAAERAVVRYDDEREWSKRFARLHRVAKEAAKQSERVTIPAIDTPVTPSSFLNSYRVVALVERGEAPPLGDVHMPSDPALAVGPEGGWSPGELDEIAAAAAGTATLGRLILRAETAAVAGAATIIQRYWKR